MGVPISFHRRIIYEWFTTVHPFGPGKGNARMRLMRKLTQDPRPPREVNPAISPALEKVLLKLLQRERDARYTDTAGHRHGPGINKFRV